jgi:hypothetical protein
LPWPSPSPGPRPSSGTCLACSRRWASHRRFLHHY